MLSSVSCRDLNLSYPKSKLHSQAGSFHEQGYSPYVERVTSSDPWDQTLILIICGSFLGHEFQSPYPRNSVQPRFLFLSDSSSILGKRIKKYQYRKHYYNNDRDQTKKTKQEQSISLRDSSPSALADKFTSYSSLDVLVMEVRQNISSWLSNHKITIHFLVWLAYKINFKINQSSKLQSQLN